MLNHFTIHNGVIHLSLDAAKSFGEMAEKGKIVTIASALRDHGNGLQLDTCRQIAKQMIHNPGHTSYRIGE